MSNIRIRNTMKTTYGSIYVEGDYIVFEHKSKKNKVRKRWSMVKLGQDEARRRAEEYKAEYSLAEFEEKYPVLRCEICNYGNRNRNYFKIHCRGKKHLARLNKIEQENDGSSEGNN